MHVPFDCKEMGDFFEKNFFGSKINYSNVSENTAKLMLNKNF